MSNYGETMEININEIANEEEPIIHDGKFREIMPKKFRVKEVTLNKKYALKLFNVHDGIVNFFKNIGQSIKRTYQRAKYGVSEYDVSHFNNYLNIVIENGLKILSQNVTGLPEDTDAESWMETLDEIIKLSEDINSDNIESMSLVGYDRFKIYSDVYGRDSDIANDALNAWLCEEDNLRAHYDNLNTSMYCKLAVYYKNFWY